jgi:hypothetical protein
MRAFGGPVRRPWKIKRKEPAQNRLLLWIDVLAKIKKSHAALIAVVS